MVDGDFNPDEYPPAKYLSYCCPFRCGLAHEVGFVDPDEARHHIVGTHGQRREANIKRWPHPKSTYDLMGVQGPL